MEAQGERPSSIGSTETDGAGTEALVLHTPINVRSTALVILTLIALAAFVQWAQAVLIPIAFSVFLSYALAPIVNWLSRKAKLPKAVGAAITLGLIVAGLGFGAESLRPEALNILDIIPRAAQKLSAAVRPNPRQPGAVEKMQKAASEIEKAANTSAIVVASPTGKSTAPIKTESDTPPFKIRDYLLMGSVSLVAGIGQFFVIVALVFFLLSAGDIFRRTLVRVSGDTLSKKKITVQILDEIDSQIQRYLLVQIVTSAMLGLVTSVIFSWIGVENALFWGLIGGILHLIPYAGPTVFVAISALISYVQFDNVQQVALVVGTTLVSIGIIGLLVVPWLTQKVGSVSAVTVFVSLLIWGWLWGVWGLLLGVPIIMAIKAVCERVEDLQPIAEFLGTVPKRTETM